MTAEELYAIVKGLMFEKTNSVDFDDNYIPYINVLLSENFDLNNSIRRRKHYAPLTKRPRIVLKTDKIPYEEEMLYEILPYGLAKNLFIDDDHEDTNIFDTMYFNSRQRYMKCAYEPYVDVYGVIE